MLLSFLQPVIVARLVFLKTNHKMPMLLHCIIKPCPVHYIQFLWWTSSVAIQYPELEISSQLSLFNINLWPLKSPLLIQNLLQNGLWYYMGPLYQNWDWIWHSPPFLLFFIWVTAFFLCIYSSLKHSTLLFFFFFKSSMLRVTCTNELAFIKQNVYRI